MNVRVANLFLQHSRNLLLPQCEIPLTLPLEDEVKIIIRNVDSKSNISGSVLERKKVKLIVEEPRRFKLMNTRSLNFIFNWA